jgi:hypothetical protein
MNIMTATWKFEPKLRSQKSRDPMQASFFTNASIDDDTHALVREAIQNSLDAKIDPANNPDPVHVRFSIGSHSSGSGTLTKYIPENAWLHFNAPDNGLTSPPDPDTDCRFLVYEDFNTKGLVGCEQACEPQDGNSFYFFMRAEGQSSKTEGERGRHGIGKYVFPYTSGIRMFIAATVRTDDNRCLIAGQSVLKQHHVNGEQFTPDGWWGDFEADNFQLPVENHDLFHEIKNDFGFHRNLEQSGLSLLMPFIQEEVTATKLTEHVIREYFWPILNRQLTVKILEDGTEKIIDHDTIHNNLDKLLTQDKLDEISPYINLCVQVIDQQEYQVIEANLPDAPRVPTWNKEYLTKEAASQIHDELSKPDSLICIRCPLHIKKEAEPEFSESHFSIFMQKDLSDTSRKPLFIREGITVPEDKVPTIRGYTCIVVIDSGSLATLLGDSENPAHTEWEKNAQKFKGVYKWGAKTIDFVRLSASKLIKLMSQGDEDKDESILSDIFYLDQPENDEEVPDTRKNEEAPKPGPDVEPTPEPPEPKPRYYRLAKAEGGFILRGPSEPMDKDRSYFVTVAYDLAGASKARAMKKYHKNDFDLSKSKGVDAPQALNISPENMSIGGNTIEFTPDSHAFKLEVSGFDQHRDIIVDVKTQEVTGEEV